MNHEKVIYTTKRLNSSRHSEKVLNVKETRNAHSSSKRANRELNDVVVREREKLVSIHVLSNLLCSDDREDHGGVWNEIIKTKE